MALDDNPIELQNGGSHAVLCRVTAVVWTGPVTAGDTCHVTKIGSGDTVYRAHAEATGYINVGLAPTHYAIPCPTGFTVSCPADTYVLVYIREE